LLRIVEELGDAQSVVNVGAGTGSYEPRDRFVVAVEPSMAMIAQRPSGAAPVVRAVAEALPFTDKLFTAALAILTIHHWSEKSQGLHELCRVAKARVVILTFDPQSPGFWLVQDYFPEFLEADRQRLPQIEEIAKFLRHVRVLPLPIPRDCRDGFLGAFWRRPAEYLRAEVRSGISSFATCSDLTALKRLERDLHNGKWMRRNRDIVGMDELDIGYRLVVGEPRM
jgi:SAM-dependent methyltransferase